MRAATKQVMNKNICTNVINLWWKRCYLWIRVTLNRSNIDATRPCGFTLNFIFNIELKISPLFSSLMPANHLLDAQTACWFFFRPTAWIWVKNFMVFFLWPKFWDKLRYEKNCFSEIFLSQEYNTFSDPVLHDQSWRQ